MSSTFRTFTLHILFNTEFCVLRIYRRKIAHNRSIKVIFVHQICSLGNCLMHGIYFRDLPIFKLGRLNETCFVLKTNVRCFASQN